jgi:hypothetical protein
MKSSLCLPSLSAGAMDRASLAAITRKWKAIESQQ